VKIYYSALLLSSDSSTDSDGRFITSLKYDMHNTET